MEIPHPDGLVIVLSGAGLSAASGVPTFRDGDGLWEGHRVEEVATPRAWTTNEDLVREYLGKETIPNQGSRAVFFSVIFLKNKISFISAGKKTEQR